MNDKIPKLKVPGFAPHPFLSNCPQANEHPKGGVCLYYKENMPIVERKDLCCLSECIFSEIKIKNKIFVVLLYRSPSQSGTELDLFIKKLEATLEKINKENASLIILTGDFNERSPFLWNEEKSENLAGKKISDLVNMNSLVQIINEPTHLPRDDIETCIDLIITNKQYAFVDSG